VVLVEVVDLVDDDEVDDEAEVDNKFYILSCIC
jgi:hypothetical protein